MSAAAIDTAVINALRNDATLATSASGGIFRDAAPEAVVNAALEDPDEVFGVVTLLSGFVSHAQGSLGLEDRLYLVKFVAPSTSPTTAQTALDRAEVVLATVTASGYAVSCSRREEDIAYVEVDGPVRWQHRGVHWRVVAGAS
jgi:hypothetical protein